MTLLLEDELGIVPDAGGIVEAERERLWRSMTEIDDAARLLGDGVRADSANDAEDEVVVAVFSGLRENSISSVQIRSNTIPYRESAIG